MDEKIKKDKLNKISKLSYEVTQKSYTEKPFLVSTMIFIRMEFM